MNILALDTCTEMCSAALYYQGNLLTRSQLTKNRHSDLIMGMMDSLFKEAGTTIGEIAAVAFGRGPGSFTGVRICAGVAQGIAYARDIPVIPVSTLSALAQGVTRDYPQQAIAVAMDARMGEIYCASYLYKQGQLRMLDEERVCPPEIFHPCQSASWVGVGTGWKEYRAVLEQNFSDQPVQIASQHYPYAEHILQLALEAASQGQCVPAEQAIPVYLRDNVAKKKAQQP